MSDIQAVIFDFNGVLEDDGRINRKVWDYAESLQGVKKAIFTGLDRTSLKIMLIAAGSNPFDETFTANSLPSMKPHPNGFREVAKKLEVPIGACVMIDDSKYNVAGAKEAGMHGVLYSSFEQMKNELESILEH